MKRTTCILLYVVYVICGVLFASTIELSPEFFNLVAVERLVVPYFSSFGSFRIWSLINYSLWLFISFVVIYRTEKCGIAKNIAITVFTLLFVLSACDLLWGFFAYLRYGIITPNAEWMGIQPFPYNPENSGVQVMTMLALAVISQRALRKAHKAELINFKSMLIGVGIFAAVLFAYDMLSPSVGWMDWGWLIIIKPELQEHIPKTVVFILNDVVTRGLVTLSFLLLGDRDVV